jgi:hypothetical protein
VSLTKCRVAPHFAEAEIVAVDVGTGVGVSEQPAGFVGVGAPPERHASGVPGRGCESVASPDRLVCVIRSWDMRVG